MADDSAGMAKGFWTWITGPGGQVALAGAMGGLVKSITLRERPLEGIGSLVVGCACSIYVSPLALVLFEPTVGKIITRPGALDTFAGFVTGVGGMAVVGFVLDVWRARRKAKGSGAL